MLGFLTVVSFSSPVPRPAAGPVPRPARPQCGAVRKGELSIPNNEEAQAYRYVFVGGFP